MPSEKWISLFYFYVFRRLLERNDDVSRPDVSINDRFPLSRDDFDELIFPSSSDKIGSGLIRIFNFGITRFWDIWLVLSSSLLLWLYSLSVVDDNELIEEVLEWRLERIVGRQIRKFGLLECVVLLNDADDDEYWEVVRWRPSRYVRGEDDDIEEDEEVDNAGERRREERDLNIIFFDIGLVVCLIGTVDDNEFELVPSEKNAESEEVVAVVVGGFRVIVIGDFDEDECELLSRWRGIILLGVNRE